MLGLIAAACSSEGTESTAPASLGPASDAPASSSAVPSAGWQPPEQALPSDSGLRNRLGPYAEFVLGESGMVPYGSSEHLGYLVTCVESAGFDVEISDGGLLAKPGSQESHYRTALAACEEAAIASGLVRPLEPPDEAELSAWYDAFMLSYECLVREGYPVSEPPSRDSYIESDGRNWHPYDRISGSDVESLCPQDLIVLFEMLAAGTAP